MFLASLSCCFRVVFLNTYCFVFAWLLLYVYVLGDVLDFVILLFQNWCSQIHIICVRVDVNGMTRRRYIYICMCRHKY